MSEYTPTSKTETEETIMNPDPVAEAPDPEIRAEKEMEPVSEEEPPKRLFSPFRSKNLIFHEMSGFFLILIILSLWNISS